MVEQAVVTRGQAILGMGPKYSDIGCKPFFFVRPPAVSVVPIGKRNHGYATVPNGLTCWSVQGALQNSPQIPSRGLNNSDIGCISQQVEICCSLKQTMQEAETLFFFSFFCSDSRVPRKFSVRWTGSS